MKRSAYLCSLELPNNLVSFIREIGYSLIYLDAWGMIKIHLYCQLQPFHWSVFKQLCSVPRSLFDHLLLTDDPCLASFHQFWPGGLKLLCPENVRKIKVTILENWLKAACCFSEDNGRAIAEIIRLSVLQHTKGSDFYALETDTQ